VSYTVTSYNIFGDESLIYDEVVVQGFGMLTSFELVEEMGQWRSATGASYRRTTDYANEGDYSLHYEVDKSKNQYPAIYYSVSPFNDWTGYTHIAFDYYNPMNVDAPLSLDIRDANKKRYITRTPLLSQNEGTIIVPITGPDIYINMANINEIVFMYGEPTENYSVYIDNIRLLDDIPPNSPSNLSASRINGTAKVEVSWTAPEAAADEDLAIRYKVYRGTSSGFELTVPLVEIDAINTFWIDENAPTDTQCYYVLTAVDKLGNESIEDLPETVVEAMGEISGCVLKNGDPLTGATVFIEELDRTYETNSSGNFTVDCLMEGSYTVIIRYPGYSSIIETIQLLHGQLLDIGNVNLFADNIPPNSPKNLTAESSLHYGMIVLNWDEPDIAEGENEEDTEFYKIYMSASADVKRNSQNLVGTSYSTSWSDVFDAKNFGRTFFYVVEAIDRAGNPSIAASNVASAKVIPPPVPEIISPKNRDLVRDTAPALRWDGSALYNSNDFIGYTIEISSDSNFSGNKTSSQDIEPNQEEHTLENQLAQGTWYWRVCARFNTGVKSGWSSVGEFVSTTLFDTTHLVPYINVGPNVMQDEFVTIRYLLTSNARVTLRIFDLDGALVANILANEVQIPGEYSYQWNGIGKDGRELFNGLYFVQLIAEPLLTQNNPSKVTKQRKLVINR